MTRTRVKEGAVAGGGYIKNYNSSGVLTSTTVGSLILTHKSTSIDTIMSQPYNVDHDLQIDHVDVVPFRAYDKTYWPNGKLKTHTAGITDPLISSVPVAPSPPGFNSGYWKTLALKNMNPNKPEVDLTNFLFELKDFPNLLKNFGNFLAKRNRNNSRLSDASDAWLSWSFGWQPLIDDVVSLFDIAKKTAATTAYLKRLSNGATIRRSLGEFPQSETITTLTSPTYLSGFRREVKTTGKVWFTANAELLGTLPDTEIEMQSLSQRLTYSLNLSPSTVWNSLPWTWLSDYFVNFGDVIEASEQGSVPWRCTRLNVMAKSVTVSRFISPNASGRFYNWRQAKMVSTRLRRYAYVNPTPVLTFTPLISQGEANNLSALATSKFLRSFRS